MLLVADLIFTAGIRLLYKTSRPGFSERLPLMAKNWYVVRVQSGKEDQVREALERRVSADALQATVCRIVVPSERISEIRGGQKRVRERKIYPGYIMVEIETGEAADIPAGRLVHHPRNAGHRRLPERREPPDLHVASATFEKILGEVEHREEAPKVKIGFSGGEAVRIKEGPFENFEGTVEEVSPAKGTVKVIVTIFGRPTPVELEYWQVERV